MSIHREIRRERERESGELLRVQPAPEHTRFMYDLNIRKSSRARSPDDVKRAARHVGKRILKSAYVSFTSQCRYGKLVGWNFMETCVACRVKRTACRLLEFHSISKVYRGEFRKREKERKRGGGMFPPLQSHVYITRIALSLPLPFFFSFFFPSGEKGEKEGTFERHLVRRRRFNARNPLKYSKIFPSENFDSTREDA